MDSCDDDGRDLAVLEAYALGHSAELPRATAGRLYSEILSLQRRLDARARDLGRFTQSTIGPTKHLEQELLVTREIVRMREVEDCCPTDDGWWLRVGTDFDNWPRVRRMTEPERALLASISKATGVVATGDNHE